MVIRIVAMPDYLDLPDFDDGFRAFSAGMAFGYIFRVHGQEFNNFRRRTRSMANGREAAITPNKPTDPEFQVSSRPD